MHEDQPWRLWDLADPLKAIGLALTFEWGVALHDLEYERIGKPGGKSLRDALGQVRGIARKAARQVAKDYVIFPLLAGPGFMFVLSGNLAANLRSNVWAFTIIICGHFPDGTVVFTQEQARGESRGAWYLRQLVGSANLQGGSLFHLLTGNLSHQIEHHLFPDLPSHRYAAIATEVHAICERYGLPYNTGTLRKQFKSVAKRILLLALPDRSGLMPPAVVSSVDPAVPPDYTESLRSHGFAGTTGPPIHD